jgi:DNA-binding transcriptional MerR regulator
MYTLGDIQDRFSWSYTQARKRVIWLSENFESEVRGGENKKYQVTDSGFEILDRIHQLEQKEDMEVNSALEQVKEELTAEETSEDVDIKRETEESKYVSLLEERVEELKKDKKRLQEKVDDMERRLLPKSEEESKESKGFMERLVEWLHE